ncbi:MAG: DNA-3-methyladenine glycosylase 2 family protein [Anaerolineaceae bacterium]|nr:DNA-3-methyladenine glycosylase 2 family protein [Anaerolineaceae bacterium]
MNTLTGTLCPSAPFEFRHATRFLGKFRPMMGQQKIEDESLTKAFYLNGQVALFKVTSVGTPDQPEMDYTIWSEGKLTREAQNQAEDEITFYLSLNDDLRPFYKLAESDPQFMPIVEKLYGYHQVKFSLTAFENACWAILSQRNLWTVALGMKERMTEQYGEGIRVDGINHRAFPLPSQVASLDPNELNDVIRNVRKTETVLAVARSFDTIDESWLRSAPYEQVDSWLKEIKGIGTWSASFILLRGLGRMERVPLDEKALLEAAKRVYGRDDLTHADVQKMGEHYGEYAGYWAHYLRVAG